MKFETAHLSRECVPDGFKTAVVTFLADDLKNYCPVSCLSFILKRVECMVVKQLLEHINVHNLDNPCQFAYKRGHSNKTTLLFIKMKFTYPRQEANLLHWYCLTSLLPLVLGILFLNGSLPT